MTDQDQGKLTSEERRLISSAVAGDRHAFDRLVVKYHPVVFAVAQSILRNRESAEELAQEVFLRAYFHLGSLRGSEQFPAWLVRITRNLAFDWQKRGRRASRLVQMVPLDEAVTEQPDERLVPFWESMVQREESREVREALYDLPIKLREVVLMHYAEELSQSEIARNLGVHPSSIGRRLESALALLRVTLRRRLRVDLRPLRSSRQAARRTIAVIGAVVLLPDMVRAEMMLAATQSLRPSLFPRWARPLPFSWADFVRHILPGVPSMPTICKLAAIGAASLTLAAAGTLAPDAAMAATTGTVVTTPTAPTAPTEPTAATPDPLPAAAPGTMQHSDSADGSTTSAATPNAGPTVSTRIVEKFDSLRVVGSMTVVIQIGNFAAPSVRVTGDSATVEVVETNSSNGTLEISPMAPMPNGSKAVIEIDTAHLDSISVEGSAKIQVRDTLGKSLAASIAGSGTIDVTGTVESVDADIAGSGKLKLQALQARDVSVRVTGSGNAEVQATEKIEARVLGSGVVRYSGNPATVEKKVSGSGNVTPAS